MNEIKFRLRDENKKIIGYEYFTQGEDLSGHWHYDFSMNGIKEWFQNFKWITKIRYRDMFTKLKDKNGTEIFETDIIKYEKTIYIVKYIWSSFVLIRPEFYEEKGTITYLNMNEVKWLGEIVGDLYTDPELLKEEK